MRTVVILLALALVGVTSALLFSLQAPPASPTRPDPSDSVDLPCRLLPDGQSRILHVAEGAVALQEGGEAQRVMVLAGDRQEFVWLFAVVADEEPELHMRSEWVP